VMTENEKIVVDKETQVEIVTRERETNDEDLDQMAKMFARFQINDEDDSKIKFVGFSEQTNTLKQIIDLKLKQQQIDSSDFENV
jgi:hypothetical protein